MKRKSATIKSAADQRLTLPLSAAWAPELIAVRIAAVLMPPRADMQISRFREPYISRRTSVKKDSDRCDRLQVARRNPYDGGETAASSATAVNRSAGGDAIRRVLMARLISARLSSQWE